MSDHISFGMSLMRANRGGGGGVGIYNVNRKLVLESCRKKSDNMLISQQSGARSRCPDLREPCC